MENEIDSLTEDQIKKAREGYVPLERLNEATGKLRDENSQLRESFSSLEAKVQALLERPAQTTEQQPAQKEYSRVELKEFVESGQISQQQADDLWDKQQETKFERKLQKAIAQERENNQQKTTVNDLKNTVKQYGEVIPDIFSAGSDERKKLKDEFNRLTRVTGVPKAESRQDFELQVMALENIYGSVEDVRRKKSQQIKHQEGNLMEDTPTHEATPDTTPDSKTLKKLDGRKKQHYQKLIDRGVYKDWQAVEDELSWRDKRK